MFDDYKKASFSQSQMINVFISHTNIKMYENEMNTRIDI